MSERDCMWSVTRFVEFCHFGAKFKIFEGVFSIWQKCDPMLAKIAIGHIFVVVNDNWMNK